MALIYTINFDSRYAGYEATVTDANGSEVDGSPVTLDGNGDATISLTALGHYRAAVFNTAGPFGDGYSVVDCVLDEPASIAAGGGGGVVLDGPVYTLEYNAGTAQVPDGGSGLKIPFDTVSEGVTVVSAGRFTIPPGFYICHINDFELSKPAEDRTAQVSVPTVGSASSEPIIYPIPIKSSDDFFATSIADTFPIVVSADINVYLTISTAAGGGDPLTLGYAFMKFQKLS